MLTSDKPTIIHIVSEFMQSNQSYTYRQFLNHVKYKIVFLSRFYLKRSRDLFPVSELHFLTSFGRVNNIISDNLFAAFVVLWSKISQAKLLHVHFGTTGAKLINLRKLLKVPFVISFYGADTTAYPLKPDWKPLYDRLFKEADAFVALSEGPRQQLMSLGAPAAKCHVVHASVDTHKFKYQKRGTTGLVKFIVAARFIEKKGYFVLLDAFKKLVDSGRPVKLIIVGFGELRERLRNRIDELGLQAHVEFNDTSQIKDYYSFAIPKYYEADVFVLPSIVASDNDQEGTPVTIIEAAATGLPVIGTNVAGIPDVVRDNITGYVIPQKNVDLLVEKMVYLTDHPEVREKFGRAGSEFMEQEFSLDGLPERLDRIYSQLLK